MRAVTRSVAALYCLALSICALALEPRDFWVTPAIEGYGKIHPLPDAAYRPKRSVSYKVVFALTKAGTSPKEVSPSLDHVARAVNLYVSAGVPLSQLKFVAVASGDATPLALNNAQYQAKFGTDNPNLALISALKKAGVDVAVCGQAMAEHDFDFAWKDGSVTLALSAMTTISTLEQQGYALLQL